MKRLFYLLSVFVIVITTEKSYGQGTSEIKYYKSLDIIFVDNSPTSQLSDGQKGSIFHYGDSIAKKTNMKFLYFCCNYNTPIYQENIKSRDVTFHKLYEPSNTLPFNYLSDREALLKVLSDEQFTAPQINMYIFIGIKEWEKLLENEPMEVSELLKDLPLQLKELYAADKLTINIIYPQNLPPAEVSNLQDITTFETNVKIRYNYENVP